MNDDELTTGNERADRLLQQIRSLGEGPAPTPQRELSRLLAGHRRSPRRRLWLVGGFSAVVIAGGAGTAAAAAHGLPHPWSQAMDGISRLWSDAPVASGQRVPPTGTALARAVRAAGSGAAGGATSAQDRTAARQDATPESVGANRPAPVAATPPAHGTDQTSGSGDDAGGDGSNGTAGDGSHGTDDGSGDQTSRRDGDGGDAGQDGGSDGSSGGSSDGGGDGGSGGGSDGGTSAGD